MSLGGARGQHCSTGLGDSAHAPTQPGSPICPFLPGQPTPQQSPTGVGRWVGISDMHPPPARDCCKWPWAAGRTQPCAWTCTAAPRHTRPQLCPLPQLQLCQVRRCRPALLTSFLHIAGHTCPRGAPPPPCQASPAQPSSTGLPGGLLEELLRGLLLQPLAACTRQLRGDLGHMICALWAGDAESDMGSRAPAPCPGPYIPGWGAQNNAGVHDQPTPCYWLTSGLRKLSIRRCPHSLRFSSGVTSYSACKGRRGSRCLQEGSSHTAPPSPASQHRVALALHPGLWHLPSLGTAPCFRSRGSQPPLPRTRCSRWQGGWTAATALPTQPSPAPSSRWSQYRWPRPWPQPQPQPRSYHSIQEPDTA